MRLRTGTSTAPEASTTELGCPRHGIGFVVALLARSQPSRLLPPCDAHALPLPHLRPPPASGAWSGWRRRGGCVFFDVDIRKGSARDLSRFAAPSGRSWFGVRSLDGTDRRPKSPREHLRPHPASGAWSGWHGRCDWGLSMAQASRRRLAQKNINVRSLPKAVKCHAW